MHTPTSTDHKPRRRQPLMRGALILALSLPGWAGAQPLSTRPPDREVRFAVPHPERHYIRIANRGALDTVFSLRLNHRGFRTLADVMADIAQLPDQTDGEPLPRKAWRWVVGHRYHWVPLTGENWYHSPTVFFNSAGFGFCDDVAHVLAFLWSEMGYQTRVWGLGGHVVPELFLDGRWQMYDPDLEVYYLDRAGRVAGATDLMLDPDLIRNPVPPRISGSGWPYSDVVVSIYESLHDNVATSYWGIGDPYVLDFALPPGASLELPYRFEAQLFSPLDVRPVPAHANARLTVPRGWRGTLRIPLIVHTLSGSGTIRLEGRLFELGSPALRTWLDARADFAHTIEVVQLNSALVVTYLLNPAVYSLQPDTTVSLYGPDVNVLEVLLATDSDEDGMDDSWEARFGLDPADPADATRDDDGDGATNFEEFLAGTHPRGFVRRYFAEGVSTGLFRTRLAVLNPDATREVLAVLSFVTARGRVAHGLPVPPHSRQTLFVDEVPGIAQLGDAAFAIEVESDAALVIDRTVTWDRNGYGSHTEAAVQAPSTTWYLAEGATSELFDLFYLIYNPQTRSVRVAITYMRPAPLPPLVKEYRIPGQSRLTIWVNYEELPEGSGEQPLNCTDVSAVVSASAPIVVERSMYLSRTRLFEGGHSSAGVAAPSLHWFFAEGATGSYFDTFVLLANPGDETALVRGTYLLGDGTQHVKQYAVAARSRLTLWLDMEEVPVGSGVRPLGDAAVSCVFDVQNGVPIVAERAMWWPGGPTSWTEAHNVAGTTGTATAWAVAEGQVGGTERSETYVLIANTGTETDTVRVTLYFESGDMATREFRVAGGSRFNVAVAQEFPEAAGRRFGAVVESASGAPLVVEVSLYADAEGRRWAAGSSATATPLR